MFHSYYSVPLSSNHVFFLFVDPREASMREDMQPSFKPVQLSPRSKKSPRTSHLNPAAAAASSLGSLPRSQSQGRLNTTLPNIPLAPTSRTRRSQMGRRSMSGTLNGSYMASNSRRSTLPAPAPARTSPHVHGWNSDFSSSGTFLQLSFLADAQCFDFFVKKIVVLDRTRGYMASNSPRSTLLARTAPRVFESMVC